MASKITRLALMVFSLYKRLSASEPASTPLWSKSTMNGSTRISLTNQWRSWCKTGRMERSQRKAHKLTGNTPVASKVVLASMENLRVLLLATLLLKRQGMKRLRQQLQPQQRNELMLTNSWYLNYPLLKTSFMNQFSIYKLVLRYKYN